MPDPDTNGRTEAYTSALAALATLMAFREYSASHPKHCQAMLQGCWEAVRNDLMSHTGKISDEGATAVMVLQEYFQHSGDWAKSVICLSGTLRLVIGAELLDASIERIRREELPEFLSVSGRSLRQVGL